jgi:branched-chain amino acid transport system ATP-binding protein
MSAEALAAAAAAALELRGVGKRFGALAALADVTMTVAPGERRTVLGSHGAGKTTLFNCITGDFPVSTGSIRLFGEDVTALPPYERIRRGLRRTYQISLLFGGLSVADNVYVACRGVGRSRFSLRRPRPSEPEVRRAEELMRATALWDERDTKVATLSCGRQR